ncbi:isochorismatase family protein [Sodalis endosymbiont of Spalangia cameroni]|uniref:isochorismatase family protein n=1 Tax=Sodalis praecaptivus TaxID=1239307 RepID=UPI0031F95205
MAQSALLIIDVQQSFEHRPFWSEAELPAFQQALLELIDQCRERGVALVDVFHTADSGPFHPDSGWVKPMTFLRHQADVRITKRVHNALTDSGLHEWLQEQGISRLIIAGLRTEQCCETTARVASDLGYQVTFVTEATLTFPMRHGGQTLSSAELKHRTETVLVDRFAAIRDVAGCLADLAAASADAPPTPVAFRPQPYQPRSITPQEPLTLSGWRLKRYRLRYPLAVGVSCFEAAWPQLTAWLPPDAQRADSAGIGVMIEHQGRERDYLVLGVWDNENELRIKIWVTDGGSWRLARNESFCVWDMQVLAFERDAYVSTILCRPPNVDAWLARTLRNDVE